MLPAGGLERTERKKKEGLLWADGRVGVACVHMCMSVCVCDYVLCRAKGAWLVQQGEAPMV